MKKVQYKFSNSFNCVEEETIVEHYSSFDDAPLYIKEFIEKESNNYMLQDKKTRVNYCPICLNKLDMMFRCRHCKKRIKINKRIKADINELVKLDSDVDCEINNHYCYFDINGENILLYSFLDKIHYKSEGCLVPYRFSNIILDRVFLVRENELIELLSNTKYLYEDIDEYFRVPAIRDYIDYLDVDFLDIQLNKDDKRILRDIADVLLSDDNYTLYTDNLDDLKNTALYKYSNLWELKNIKYNINILSITMYPIYYKQFELLMKLGLNKLALLSPFAINEGKTFKERFGIDKKYLDFMKEIQIDYYGLKCLRVYPTDSRHVFSFVRDYKWYLDDIADYVDIEYLIKYLNKYNADLFMYYDYLIECKNQGYNLKDKSILYPKNFMEEHDKIFAQSLIIRDKEINEKINSLSKIYGMNIYEDDKYIIFPASSIEALIDESNQMSNCVKSYCERISDKDTQIYFMRKKDNKDKSLVTIEVNNNKVIQALSRFNKEISDEEKMVVDKFEKSLLSIRVIEG